MDSDGLRKILNATPSQLRLLESKLAPGQAYSFAIDTGPDFDSPTVSAWLRPHTPGYELRLASPVRYSGADQTLARLAREGWYRVDDLEDLATFLRRHFAPAVDHDSLAQTAPTHGRAPQTPGTLARDSNHPHLAPRRPQGAEIADLAAARKQLEDQPVPRLLLDPAELARGLQRQIHGQHAVLDILARRISPRLLSNVVRRAETPRFGVRFAEQLVERELAPKLVELLRRDARVSNVELDLVNGELAVQKAD